MKIVLCTPSRGQLDYEHLQCVDSLIAVVRRLGAGVVDMSISRVYDCSLLDHARSRMATNFLRDTDYDVLCWVDDDMIFDAEELLEICSEAHEREAIVGAVCSTRGPLGKLCTKFGESVTELGFFSEGGVHAAVSIGCGLTAVSRRVFERLVAAGEVPECNIAGSGAPEPIYPFYQTLLEDNVWWGEDTSFCVRARRTGSQVFADTRARVGHKGSYTFHIEDTRHSVQLYKGIRTKLLQPGELPDQPFERKE